MNMSVNYRGALGADGERVTGRKARGVQVAGRNKLQVVDVLFPSLLMKSVLPKSNFFFFFFSNLGVIMAQQTSIHVNGLWLWDTLCHPVSKVHFVGDGPGEIPSALRSLLTD